jgi:hypothetical protein
LNCYSEVFRCLFIGYGITALNYTDYYKGCLYRTINFFYIPIASQSARIYAISISEQTTSVNSPKEYVQ